VREDDARCVRMVSRQCVKRPPASTVRPLTVSKVQTLEESELIGVEQGGGGDGLHLLDGDVAVAHDLATKRFSGASTAMIVTIATDATDTTSMTSMTSTTDRTGKTSGLERDRDVIRQWQSCGSGSGSGGVHELPHRHVVRTHPELSSCWGAA
jgi:hypothetical protein